MPALLVDRRLAERLAEIEAQAAPAPPSSEGVDLDALPLYDEDPFARLPPGLDP